YGVPPRPPTNLDPNTLAELLKAIREGNGDALAKKLREDRALQEWAKRQVGKIDFDDPKVQEMLRNMVGKFDRAPDLKGSDSAPLVDILKGVQQKLPAERMSEGGPALPKTDPANNGAEPGPRPDGAPEPKIPKLDDADPAAQELAAQRMHELGRAFENLPVELRNSPALQRAIESVSRYDFSKIQGSEFWKKAADRIDWS